MKKFLLIMFLLCVTLAGYTYYGYRTKVTRYELPKGELKWSNVKPKGAKMCLPAAFTTAENTILGAYRIDSKTRGHNSKRMSKVSLRDNSFIVTHIWRSKTGFQQLALVKDSKPQKFNKDKRRHIRRALCKKNGKAFILQSNYPMTLTAFANYCSRHCDNAVYLDMGEYGFGYIKSGLIPRPLFIWGIFTQHKQTNWIYIE